MISEKKEDHGHRFKGESAEVLSHSSILKIPPRFIDCIQDKGVTKFSIGKKDNYLCCFPTALKELSELVRATSDDDTIYFYSNNEMKDFLIDAVEVGFSENDHSTIAIPLSLLADVGIKNDVVVIGMFNHFEMWSPEIRSEETRVEEDVLKVTVEAIDEVMGEE